MATIKGRWILDTSINTNADTQTAFNCAQNVNFTSNGENITQITIGDNASVGYSTIIKYLIGSDLKTVYDGTGSGWTSAAYRTVDFGETEQEVSDDFRNWMEEYATPKYAVNFTVDGEEYSILANSNWAAIADIYPDKFWIYTTSHKSVVYLIEDTYKCLMDGDTQVNSTDVVKESGVYTDGGGDSVGIEIVDAQYLVDRGSYWSTIVEKYPTIFAIDETDNTVIWLAEQTYRIYDKNGTPVRSTDRVILPTVYTAEVAWYIRGKWVFNETIPVGTVLTQKINFTSNNVRHSEIHCDVITAGSYTISCITYDDDHVASGLETCIWEDYDYREVDFGNSPQIISKEFYDWFTANAAEPVRTVKGEWAIVEHPTFTIFEQEVTFEHAKYGTLLGMLCGGDVLYFIGDQDTGMIPAYTSTGWADEKARYIDFGDTEQIVGEEFYKWFKNYMVADVETITGKRIFNAHPTLIVFDEDVEFTSFDSAMTKMRSTGSKLWYVISGNTEEILAYNSGSWTTLRLKIVDFGDEGQKVSGKFYRWIEDYTEEYNGEETATPDTIIIPLSVPKSIKLNTKDKICDRDIVVKVTIPTYKGEVEDYESNTGSEDTGSSTNLITLYVDGNEYQVEAGTKWADITTYYPDDFTIDTEDSSVYWKGAQVLGELNVPVNTELTIINGTYYNVMSG